MPNYNSLHWLIRYSADTICDLNTNRWIDREMTWWTKLLFPPQFKMSKSTLTRRTTGQVHSIHLIYFHQGFLCSVSEMVNTISSQKRCGTHSRQVISCNTVNFCHTLIILLQWNLQSCTQSYDLTGLEFSGSPVDPVYQNPRRHTRFADIVHSKKKNISHNRTTEKYFEIWAIS